MKINDFRDLEVWQLSVNLTVKIYKLVEKFPTKEKFCLIDQLIRAANSIGANIAEGFGRYSGKEFVKFLYISRGSLNEVLSFLSVSNRLSYIDSGELEELEKEIRNLGVKINNLINSIKKTIE